MSRLYLSASSFRSHRLIATASERSEVRNEISSLKPVCFRSRGRTSFSRVRVNSPAVLAFRWMDTLRAYISRLLGYSDVNLDDYDVCLCLLHLSRGSVHAAHATAAPAGPFSRPAASTPPSRVASRRRLGAMAPPALPPSSPAPPAC